MISINDVELELNASVDATLHKELLDNASIILTTLKGTNPQNRAMGLVSGDIVGKNANVAKCSYSVQAIEQIALYEPRLSVSEVNYLVTENKIIPKVVLKYNVS